MKVIIDGKKIRIMGKNFGEDKYRPVCLTIYVDDETPGRDYYSISTIKDIFEIGNLPSLTVSKDDVIIQNNLPTGRSIV